MLRVGSKAPDLTLPDQHGKARTLSQMWAAGPVVLYFYPKDETAGCTAEACSFRDSYESFKDAGAEVVGVSRDDASSHASFAKHHRLPFVLLSDVHGAAHKAYEVNRKLGIMPGRITYVIDTQGTIRCAFESLIRMSAHAEEALVTVRGLARVSAAQTVTRS